MQNYKDNDYALNKKSEGIVYRFANGTLEITLTDYMRENPDKTPEDFSKLKAISDADYKERDRLGYQQTWKNTSYDVLEESGSCYSLSPEESMIDDFEAQEEAEHRGKRVILAKRLLDKLTDVQRKRYLLYVVKGLSTHQIAEKEGVNQKSVYECLQAVEKKVKKFLESN